MAVLRRPGEALSNRPLYFCWIVDCSGSMRGEKIDAVNDAIRSAIPDMLKTAKSNPNVRLWIQTLRFSTGATFVTENPVQIEEYVWEDLVTGGRTEIGKACDKLSEQLTTSPMPERALPPVLVLLSDGHPTQGYKRSLRRLLSLPWGTKAVKIAIAIGKDADQGMLEEFTGDRRPVLKSGSPEALLENIKWASTFVSAVSSPASRGFEAVCPASNAAWTIDTIPDTNLNSEDAIW